MTMNKYTTWCFAGLISLSTQCKEPGTWEPTYQAFRNGSDYNLTLSFHGDTDSIGFELPTGDTLKFIGKCIDAEGTECWFDWLFAPGQGGYGEATLDFEDGKRLTVTHEFCNGERQLLGSWDLTPEDCGFYYTRAADTAYLMFEINNSDYEAATAVGN